MITERQKALGRAIERLSGRDLANFVTQIHNSTSTSEKWLLQRAILDFSTRLTEAKEDQP
jgi:hypothetical protein